MMWLKLVDVSKEAPGRHNHVVITFLSLYMYKERVGGYHDNV